MVMVVTAKHCEQSPSRHSPASSPSLGITWRGWYLYPHYTEVETYVTGTAPWVTGIDVLVYVIWSPQAFDSICCHPALCGEGH